MSSLPEEIHIEILSRLPVKSTLVCKSVCKYWYALISNPNFVKLHHNLSIQKTNFNLMISKLDYRCSQKVYSFSCDSLSLSSNEFHLYGLEIDRPVGSFDYNFELMDSSNGLVCIWIYGKELFGLWNPDSKEYKELPKSPNRPVDPYEFQYASGYDYEAGDYKLICLYDSGDGASSVVDVYMMRPNSWKNTQVIPFTRDGVIEQRSGVLANGFFHWLVGNSDTDNYSHVLLSLDISNEKFKELLLPRETVENNNLLTSMGVLKECLCVFSVDVNVDVWVMQDYGVQESWTRNYAITHERIVKQPYDWRHVWCFNSGEILLATFDSPIDLILYDPKDGSARKPNTHICGIEEYNYLGSLVSLDFSTYMGCMAIR